jgi:DNA-binding GntR family transcriptional regulator
MGLTKKSRYGAGMKHEIYDKLRERILYIEYEPGCILNEQKLAKEFGVSRTPLRTVLFRLEWEHLVKILPRTGILVTELEMNRLMNVYQARLEIEEVIGRLAAEHFLPAYHSRFDELSAECDRLLDHRDPKALAAVDMGIHSLFHEAANNPFLTEMSHRLYGLTFRLWYFNMKKMNINEWRNEVVSIKEELNDLSALLTHDDCNAVGRARKRHLLKHLERIRFKFLGLSGNPL